MGQSVEQIPECFIVCRLELATTTRLEHGDAAEHVTAEVDVDSR